jgi:hypothetical protein
MSVEKELKLSEIRSKITLDHIQTMLNKPDKKKDGMTPLHVAAALGCIEIVKELLEAGVDVNQINTHGKSALHFAAENDRKDVVKLLLQNPRVDVNKADIFNETPLCASIKSANEDVVKLFLQDLRVDVNKFIYNGKAFFPPVGWKLSSYFDMVELIQARAVRGKTIEGLDRTIKAKSSNKESAEEIKILIECLIKNPDDEEKKSALQTLVKKELEIAKENKGKKLFPKLLHRSNFIPALEKLQLTPTKAGQGVFINGEEGLKPYLKKTPKGR